LLCFVNIIIDQIDKIKNTKTQIYPQVLFSGSTEVIWQEYIYTIKYITYMNIVKNFIIVGDYQLATYLILLLLNSLKI